MGIKIMIFRFSVVIAFFLCIFTCFSTPTENNGIDSLYAQKTPVIDGKFDDWRLERGIFVCGDVEKSRDTYGIWIHSMYDQKYLYVLARWIDKTPLNNPGQVLADYGWLGDSLQMRIRTRPDTPDETISHWTCWKGKDGTDTCDVAYGAKLDKGNIRNAKGNGVLQAFSINEAGNGYVQEIAIPWKLIMHGDKPVDESDKLQLGIEANFTLDNGTRLSIKGNFQPGIEPDRVFTNQKFREWGSLSLFKNIPDTPWFLRLADDRKLPMTLADGIPSVSWNILLSQDAKGRTFPGIKEIKFNCPEDGYVSLVIKDEAGKIIRHLVNNQKYPKGENLVSWDGLTEVNWEQPGEVAGQGEYTVHGLFHPKFKIEFKGWAGSQGNPPWENGPTSNWGGDHGPPTACAADKSQVYLGWAVAESGRPLICCDLKGKVLWRKKFGGMSGVKSISADEGVLYVLGGSVKSDAINGGVLYKLDAENGNFLSWDGDIAELAIKELKKSSDTYKGLTTATAVTAVKGRVYLSFSDGNIVMALDGKSGKLLNAYQIPSPVMMCPFPGDRLAVVSGGNYEIVLDKNSKHYFSPELKAGSAVYLLNINSGESKKIDLRGQSNVLGIAADSSNQLFIGVGEPENQVIAYDREGNIRRTIGMKGGRQLLGEWQQDGMRFLSAMAIDGEGKLWLTESDNYPRRFSIWNTQTGVLEDEFFGPAHYGATGSAIVPDDPTLISGLGCEWRIDHLTGRSKCNAIITRDGMWNSAYVKGENGRLYFITSTEWRAGDIKIYEKTAPCQYKLRATFDFKGARNFGSNRKPVDKNGKPIPSETAYWADRNGDEVKQEDEITRIDEVLEFNPWYLYAWPDFSMYSGNKRFRPTGFTACGAPVFNLLSPEIMPVAGVGSRNGKISLKVGGDWGRQNSWFEAYDMKTKELLWRYPNNFIGVQGSHSAPSFPQPGLIRGSYGPLNALTFPEPVGDAWIIPTNVGEWHVLTSSGFYLTNIFNGDYMNWRWPDKAVPGADMTDCPSGGGGEDFGGYITVAKDGNVYAQSGHTAYWLLEIKGWDKVVHLPNYNVAITEADMVVATKIREEMLQVVSKKKSRITVKTFSPKFTGNIKADFTKCEFIHFEKSPDTAVDAACSWDAENLYVGWQVKDSTPWVNGASAPEFLYATGDTVDLQVGMDEAANPKRTEPGKGDIRISVGNFKGKPKVVGYRKVSEQKKPKTFSSGVVANYPMDWVGELKAKELKVTTSKDGYTVEIALPWSELGRCPKPGESVNLDFGVTYGDAKGLDTMLRNHWSNQHTGIVNDEVFELKMESNFWGAAKFE